MIIGYDDEEGKIWMNDPWGRNTSEIQIWPYWDFFSAWNYTEQYAPGAYFGALVAPWQISVSQQQNGNSIDLQVNTNYPCFPPFDCTQYASTDTMGHISTSTNLEVIGPSLLKLGNFDAGTSKNLSWKLKHKDSNPAKVHVKVAGLIKGHAPEAPTGNVTFPAYNYQDEIGGETKIYF